MREKTEREKREPTVWCPVCKSYAPTKWIDKKNNICELCKLGLLEK